MKKSNILGKELKNNLPGMTSHIKGRPLLNANGDVDPNSTGFKYIIDTLSYIRAEVIDQRFYEVAISDYVPMDVGEAAWSDEIVQNLVFQEAGSFYEGDMNTYTGHGRVANVDAALSPIRMPTQTWAKKTGWSVFEIAKAAAANNWDVVETKLKTIKKNWDLGIQETAFLGHISTADMTGLLNNPEVNINTTLITIPISTMTETQLTAFLLGLLPAYYANSNSTILPDTFIIPTDDYLGLGTPYSSTYPMKSKLEYMLDMLRKMTGNPGFEIKPLAYSQAANNAGRGINKNRYVLYRNEAETIKMTIPVDFTMLEADTSNRLSWTQPAYGQYSGVLFNKVAEVIYFDDTP